MWGTPGLRPFRDIPGYVAPLPMHPLRGVAENGDAIMRANQRRFCSGILGGRFCRKTRKQNPDVSRCVSRRMRRAACALLLLALAMSFTLASHAAQNGSASPAATQNSTSLNGPGNVFLTANQYGSGGTGTLYAALADFNGDGKLDYVTANQGNNTIGIALGNG